MPQKLSLGSSPAGADRVSPPPTPPHRASPWRRYRRRSMISASAMATRCSSAALPQENVRAGELRLRSTGSRAGDGHRLYHRRPRQWATRRQIGIGTYPEAAPAHAALAARGRGGGRMLSPSPGRGPGGGDDPRGLRGPERERLPPRLRLRPSKGRRDRQVRAVPAGRRATTCPAAGSKPRTRDAGGLRPDPVAPEAGKNSWSVLKPLARLTHNYTVLCTSSMRRARWSPVDDSRWGTIPRACGSRETVRDALR